MRENGTREEGGREEVGGGGAVVVVVVQPTLPLPGSRSKAASRGTRRGRAIAGNFVAPGGDGTGVKKTGTSRAFG